MAKVPETRKGRKIRKQLFSKKQGLIAHYAKKLRDLGIEQEEQEKEKAKRENAAKSSSVVTAPAGVSSAQTGAGQALANNPELAQWTQSRKTGLRRKKKEAMDRWSMATSGGNFRGR